MTAIRQEKLAALREVITYNPLQFGLVICLSLSTAVLEGIGLSFLLPIVEQASTGQLANASEHDLVAAFETAYGLVGIPFTFETLLAGAALAIGLRFGTAVLTQYLRVRLVLDYIRTLKTAVFDSILTAELSYIDDRGSDMLLNMLITQTDYPANVLSSVLSAGERALLVLVYLALAFTVNPLLTGGAAVVLTIITLGIKSGIGSAYDEGDHVSQANEEMQSHAQSGVQGLRDVRLFGVTDTVSTRYADAVDEYMQALVSLRVNQSLVSSLHRFAAALAVLAMVYLALGWSAMSLGAVGVFLFAMMRLAPSVANLQGDIYYIDGELPHLIETLREQEELAARRTASTGTRSVPQPVNSITVENVSFQYADDESGLTNATLSAQRGEFVAIVGESGAGKSTIVSLLARLYEPDDGRILVNETALQTIDTDAWRRTIAVVRQDPYLFDETLQNNIVVGTDVDEETLVQACTDARIDEFVHTLPDGYQTQLGDEGVRLSGGQKQRVAIARALVRDPDVLILDEATSNLDASLEQDVLQAIQQAAQNCIVLIITHRLGSVTAADRIYTVEDGQVVESGQHSELLTADEAYASLYAVDPMQKTGRPETDD